MHSARRRRLTGVRRSVAATVVLLVASAATAVGAPAAAATTITYTYEVRTLGTVRSNVNLFIAHAQSTYADARGWGLGGSIRFARVASGGHFTLWLAQASKVPTFSSVCSALYSCRVGRHVIINDDRWAFGSSRLNMALDDYRHMVVNHETGHWLGFGHRSCPGAGQPAFVMQQQSKGGTYLGACVPNPWPRQEEREALGRSRGVPVATGNPFGAYGTHLYPGGLRFDGWAVDPDTSGPVQVHAYVGRAAASATAALPRPDVGALYPATGPNHGFDDLIVPAAHGTHTVCAYGINDPVTPGVNPVLHPGCRMVALTGVPIGSYGVNATSSTIQVEGWALDPDVTSAVSVHVYVDGAAVAVLADGDRPDVGAAFRGFGPAHGFDVTLGPLAAGPHHVCAHAINDEPNAANPLLHPGCIDLST